MNKNFRNNGLFLSVFKTICLFISFIQFSGLLNAGEFRSIINAKNKDLYQFLRVNQESNKENIKENIDSIRAQILLGRRSSTDDKEVSEAYEILTEDDLRRIYDAYGYQMAQSFRSVKIDPKKKITDEEGVARMINSIKEFKGNSERIEIFCRINIPILFYQAAEKFCLKNLSNDEEVSENKEEMLVIEKIVTDFYMSKFYERKLINEMLITSNLKEAFLIEQDWFKAYLNKPSTKEKGLADLVIFTGFAISTLVADPIGTVIAMSSFVFSKIYFNF